MDALQLASAHRTKREMARKIRVVRRDVVPTEVAPRHFPAFSRCVVFIARRFAPAFTVPDLQV
jgi:hypothetical protein